MKASLTDLIARTLRQDVQGMHAYAVQPSAGMVKLDMMENPHRLPPALRQVLGERLAEVHINRYPAAGIEDLRAALARHAAMPEGCALTLGNGSDEIIALLSMALAPGSVVMAPVPTFVMYGMSAQTNALRFVGVPLRADFELDVAAMLEAIAAHKPALLWLAYPNNPTANAWDRATIEELIAAVGEQGGLVVMDEAYQPFAEADSMAWLGAHEHVLVMRTMSKFGLAGVRIGYLMGRAALIEQIEKLRPPFNIGVLNAEAALFALEHEDEFARQAASIRVQRERLMAALQALPGATPFQSQGNMILVRLPDAAAAFAALKARRILVKNVSAMHPLLANCLRLTIGTPDETALLIEALKDILR
jgi:histidinol-phosphate aminotransferase